MRTKSWCSRIQGTATLDGLDSATAPRTTLWAYTPETAAKHQVLRGYLEAWLPILGTKAGRIVLIDGFAGPGRYVTGEPGSPLVMLDALLSHRALDSITAEVVFVFMEKDAGRVAHLQKELGAIALPARVKVSVLHGYFHELIGPVLDDIENRGQKLAPTFAFIDPFGYRDTRLDLSSRILGHPRCEVLIYVPVPFIARFIDAQTVPADALDMLYGDDRWRQAQNLGSAANAERSLTDLLLERLHEDCEHVRSFEIVGSGPNNGATLFFGTNHPIGLARMKESMWKTDPASGTSFKDSTREGQIALFEPAPDVQLLERLLHERFGTSVFRIEDALDHVVLATPFIKSHVKTRTLKPAEAAGRIEVVEASGTRRAGTFPDGTRLRFIDESP